MDFSVHDLHMAGFAMQKRKNRLKLVVPGILSMDDVVQY